MPSTVASPPSSSLIASPGERTGPGRARQAAHRWMGTLCALWLCAGLSACATEPGPARDRRLYQQAIGAAQPAEALELCAAIGDLALRGECTVAGATAAALDDDERIAWEGCAALPEGLWRDECGFVVVDKLELSGPEAWRACQRAGRFRGPCVGHAVTRAIASWEDLPVELGQEKALEAEIRLRVRQMNPPMDMRSRQTPITTGFTRKLASRFDDRIFDVRGCGEASATHCSRAYAETMPTHMPDVDRAAICGQPLTAEGVKAAGGAPWSPGSEAVVRLAWDDLCRSWGLALPTVQEEP